MFEVVWVLLMLVSKNQMNKSIIIFPQHCIRLNISCFHYIKIQIELLAKINVVNNALVLTSNGSCELRSQKAHIPHMGSHFDTSIACAICRQRASTMHIFDRHWLSQTPAHTVNTHFPLHSLEVFMIAIQEEAQELPLALNLIMTTTLCNFCNSF